MKPNKASNIVTYILGMAFNLAIMAVVAYAIYHFALRGFAEGEAFAADMLRVGPDYEVMFILEDDLPRAEVARRLEHMGLIPNQWLFRLEMFLKNSTRVYRAGTYTLNMNMTNTEINATLRRGQASEHAEALLITIREGWTIKQMAEYFEYREFFTAEEFIDYTNTGQFNFRFLRDAPDHPERNPLEGYLFPDTYEIPLNPTPRDIIIRMLMRFENVITGYWYYRAEELGFTMDQIITMASVIEGETGRPPEERPKISQVIHSRLRAGMLLQMDATAIYVLDVHPSRVLNEHLQIESPFNTHIHLGLPIGPINNPGRASIEAALFPSDTNYLFFVVDYADHTRHVFNANYADHSAAAARFWASLDQ